MFAYFDLGNVLLAFDHGLACRQMAAVSGVAEQRVRELVFESGLELAYERGDLSTDEFYRRFCDETGAAPDRCALLRAASDIFTRIDATAELVRRLRAQGRPVGLLSNTCEAHWEFVRESFPELPALFDVLVLSYEVRALKPEPEIYRRAASAAGATAESLFFVDDRAENVAAAREAGWDAVAFTDPRALESALRERTLLE